MKAGFLGRMAISAALAALLWAVFAVGLRRFVRAQETSTCSRLAAGTRLLIEKSHHSQDDLTIQNTMQSMSQIPGVTLICVTEPSGRIIADPEPTLIGQNIENVHRTSYASVSTLRSGSSAWGLLWLGFVDRPLRQKSSQARAAGGGLLAAAWLLYLIEALRGQRLIQRLQNQASDATTLQEEQADKLDRMTRAAEERRKISERWVAVLIDQWPAPAIFLDERQRVVGVNQRMLHYSKFGDLADWVGKSWQEISCLQACGHALEKSLESPGKTVEDVDPLPHGRLCFKTPQDSSGRLLGTWVTLLE